MAETVSDVSMPDAEGDVTEDIAATLDGSGATIQSATSQETAGLSELFGISTEKQFLEQKHHQGYSLQLRTSSRMSSTRLPARSDQLSRISLSKLRIRKRHSLKCGSTQQIAMTRETCGPM